ncbi:MAG: Holliday junction branch migration DNA helicase RuvB [Actinomycetota bacterium]|nr:Holliday junction branch migration DNA helicase RuvB [Actinomycetota bacterium]
MSAEETAGFEAGAEILAVTAAAPEEEAESSLRPRSLDDFVGQPELKEHMGIVLQAALERGEPVGHLLLSGPPGLGKTTLAHVIAREMGANIRQTSGPALERAGDLAAILTNLEDSDVLFIDEIHRLPRTVEEVLYPAMEDFQLDLVIGKGPSAQTIRLDLPRFTLTGATTRAGLITGPLRSRFELIERLDLYPVGDLETIVLRSARILGVGIDAGGAREIAARSRGTPRIANRLLRRVRDFAQVRADGVINVDVARAALTIFRVDELGLDKVDAAILDAIIRRFGGGPVGLSTLAVAVGEETDTIEDVYEPYLLQSGLIRRTPRGRMATERAFAHLGIEPPSRTLFDS